MRRPRQGLALLVFALLTASGCWAQRDCYGAVVEVAVSLGGQPEEAFYGYPAPFGAALNDTATAQMPLVAAHPATACEPLARATLPGAAALVARGNCSFTEKAKAVQAAGFEAMLLFNNDEECVLMSANRSEAEGLRIMVASLTAEAGAALAALAAAHPAGGGDAAAVALRMPALGAVDWSSLALWLLATSTVAAGALWAGQGHLAGLGRESGTPTAKKGGAGDVPSVTISSRAAVGFVLLASAMLVLLFFFLDKWLAYILVGLFALGAWQACGMVIYSALQQLSSPQWRAAQLRLPGAGLVPVNGVLATAAGATLCAVWAVWHNAPWSWPLQDAMGVCFMLVILKQFFLPNLKVATILLCLAFVYDVWWVFLQPLVTGGESVMVEVATGGASHEQLPMVLRFPHHPLGTNPAFAILGLGDVVLPGLLAVFCRRFDLSNRLPLSRAFFPPCLAGYGCGLLLTYCALWFSWFGDQGQPALLYLVPCTLGTVSALALSRGQVAQLWLNDFEGSNGLGSAQRSSDAGDAGEHGGSRRYSSEADRLESGLERLLSEQRPSPRSSPR
ncbi:hypothetical protein ABPG77_010547 [Micractinium sp. CCAP 211/92]